jgi:hypothetical protein
VPDDRLLPATRWTAAAVVPILVTAGVILYFFPGDTADLWAWPINPPLTALVIGGGYLSGAVFFARALWVGRWHMMALGLPAATILTTMLLVATILHWDLFSHDHPAFWAWLAIYLVTPVLLPALWLLNRGHDPGPGTLPGLIVPGWTRTVVAAAGAVQLIVALAFFVRPSLTERYWPWPLSPLTARTLSAFLAFIAVMLLGLLIERRWNALRLLIDSAALGLALVGIAVVREYGDLTVSRPGRVAFLVVLAGYVLGLLAVRLTVRDSSAPPP